MLGRDGKVIHKLSTSSVLLVEIFRTQLIQGESLSSHLACVAADGKARPRAARLCLHISLAAGGGFGTALSARAHPSAAPLVRGWERGMV